MVSSPEGVDSRPDSVIRLQRSPIGRLALSLYPHDPCGRFFLVFTAFYDESGTHKGSPITVLGGFFGGALDWADFDREWRKVLVKHDLRFVRAKQLFHRQGPYRGWTQKQIDYLWADLLYVLQEHKGFQISKIVLRDEDYYRSYVSDGPYSKYERLDTKYGLCVRVALHFLPMVHHRLKAAGSVNFVVEAGHKNAGDALRIFTELKGSKSYSWAPSIGAISFGTKPDFPALQAADLISYWFYKTEMTKIREDIDDPFAISGLERELAQLGMGVLRHVITPLDLANLRQNFLAKNKRKVFAKVQAVLKAGEYLKGAWDTPAENELFGVELNEDLAIQRR
jgi:hypothetical protein